MANPLCIHHLAQCSYANGPGARAVIWFQGCSLGCKGCYNPETHSSDGEEHTVEDLVEWIQSCSEIQGVTISGGEPLQQFPSLLLLLERVRQETGLSIIIFTGYELNELESMPEYPRLQQLCDVLISGRYRHDQRVAKELRGSENKQTFFFTDRYSQADMAAPAAEVIIDAEGNVTLSGIDPLVME